MSKEQTPPFRLDAVYSNDGTKNQEFMSKEQNSLFTVFRYQNTLITVCVKIQETNKL